MAKLKITVDGRKIKIDLNDSDLHGFFRSAAENGVTNDELVEAWLRGRALTTYLNLRAAGIDHNELMSNGLWTTNQVYMNLRLKNGCSHKQALAVSDQLPLSGDGRLARELYRRLRARGVSHKRSLELALMLQRFGRVHSQDFTAYLRNQEDLAKVSLDDIEHGYRNVATQPIPREITDAETVG